MPVDMEDSKGVNVGMPKGATPLQVNQIRNQITQKEATFWPSAKGREFRLNGSSRLKTDYVARPVNPRTTKAVYERLVQGANSPRMLKELNSIATQDKVPHRKSKSQKTLTRIQSVEEFLDKNEEEKFRYPKLDRNLTEKMERDKIPAARRLVLPDLSSQEVGRCLEMASVQASRHTYKWRRPKSLCPLTTYAENYYETIGSNPFAGKSLFPTPRKGGSD